MIILITGHNAEEGRKGCNVTVHLCTTPETPVLYQTV
jgi:hypothetical protein